MKYIVSVAAVAACLFAETVLADVCMNLTYDGSAMRLYKDGLNVSIVYVRPRAGLDVLGIRPGTVAFKGMLLPDNSIGGRAYYYKPGCAPVANGILGRIEGNDIVMWAATPRWTGCQVAPPKDGETANVKYLFRGMLAPGAPVMHNGSQMGIERSGDAVEIHYVAPRPGLAVAGVQPGALVFKGRYDRWQNVAGTAYVFKKGCQAAGYAVIGEVTGSTLELRGNPPKRDGCIVGREDPAKLNSALVFTGLPSFMTPTPEAPVDTQSTPSRESVSVPDPIVAPKRTVPDIMPLSPTSLPKASRVATPEQFEAIARGLGDRDTPATAQPSTVYVPPVPVTEAKPAVVRSPEASKHALRSDF